jgi:hypothetical protein
MPAPYRLFYVLPGVDGIRVPARLAMVMALMLAVAAGFVVARLPRTRLAAAATVTIVAAFVIEAPAYQFPLNGVIRTPGFGEPERRVFPPPLAPPLYRNVAALPGHVVLLELPMGDPNWDVRAVYYSTAHWRSLVNGYSGFFPPWYFELATALRDHELAPEEGGRRLRDTGATHVLVHDRGFSRSDAAAMHRWLQAQGASAVASASGDTLYSLRR